MHYLALDIGTRRTGVAFLDDDVGFPFPLDTLMHSAVEDWAVQVMEVISQRQIDQVYVGLPRLPSGEEGSQARLVRQYAQLLEKEGVKVQFVDERYTTPRKDKTSHKRQIPERTTNVDAAAACEILKIARSY